MNEGEKSMAMPQVPEFQLEKGKAQLEQLGQKEMAKRIDQVFKEMEGLPDEEKYYIETEIESFVQDIIRLFRVIKKAEEKIIDTLELVPSNIRPLPARWEQGYCRKIDKDKRDYRGQCPYPTFTQSYLKNQDKYYFRSLGCFRLKSWINEKIHKEFANHFGLERDKDRTQITQTIYHHKLKIFNIDVDKLTEMQKQGKEPVQIKIEDYQADYYYGPGNIVGSQPQFLPSSKELAPRLKREEDPYHPSYSIYRIERTITNE